MSQEASAKLSDKAEEIGSRPAFPYPPSGPGGMTYREWLIGQVAVGILSGNASEKGENVDITADNIACDALMIADKILLRLAEWA
jgi:hypothetical protein